MLEERGDGKAVARPRGLGRSDVVQTCCAGRGFRGAPKGRGRPGLSSCPGRAGPLLVCFVFTKRPECCLSPADSCVSQPDRKEEAHSQTDLALWGFPHRGGETAGQKFMKFIL